MLILITKILNNNFKYLRIYSIIQSIHSKNNQDFQNSIPLTIIHNSYSSYHLQKKYTPSFLIQITLFNLFISSSQIQSFSFSVIFPNYLMLYQLNIYISFIIQTLFKQFMFPYTNPPFFQYYYQTHPINAMLYLIPSNNPISQSPVNQAIIQQHQIQIQSQSESQQSNCEQYKAKNFKSQVKKVKKMRIKSDNMKEKKKNIRNIIPNIARKIINYISSSQSKIQVRNLFPHMTKPQISKFYQYFNNLKNSLSFYVGNRDLHQIWYKDTKSIRQNEYLKIIRILSKLFLDKYCISSILLSKRMKKSLKQEHLHYRRKMLEILKNGFKEGFKC